MKNHKVWDLDFIMVIVCWLNAHYSQPLCLAQNNHYRQVGLVILWQTGAVLRFYVGHCM